MQLRLDLARRFWLKPKVEAIWEKEGIGGLLKIVGGMMGKHENAMLAARYQALEQYPRITRALLLGVLPQEWVCPAGGKGRRPGTHSVSRLRARPIRLWNDPRRRGSDRLFQRRLSAARPLHLCVLRAAAVSYGHPHDAYHEGTHELLQPGESHDRAATRRGDEYGSERRLGLLACDG